MKKLLILPICIVLMSACGKTEKLETQSEIYLVRHFQKQAVTPLSGKDVELSDEGHVNAKRLSEYLKSKGIAVIYSTEYKRTKQTATPTSELINIPIEIYNPSELEAFASQLLGTNKNQLVVGHSNTTGVLFGFLGCEPIVLNEDDYGDIMVLKRSHTELGSTILACSSYQLGKQAPVIANLLFVKQSDLHKYYKQTNAAFTINNVLKTESSKDGIVEVGFIIDENGNTSSFEIVKSAPESNWHTQALNAAQQLTFSPHNNSLPIGKSVYTTWVFEFTAN